MTQQAADARERRSIITSMARGRVGLALAVAIVALSSMTNTALLVVVVGDYRGDAREASAVQACAREQVERFDVALAAWIDSTRRSPTDQENALDQLYAVALDRSLTTERCGGETTPLPIPPPTLVPTGPQEDPP